MASPAEVNLQFEMLKKECQLTVDLLNKLLKLCFAYAKVISKMDSSFKHRSNIIVAVQQYNSSSLRKLMKWNFDLQELLSNNKASKLNRLMLKFLQTNKSPESFDGFLQLSLAHESEDEYESLAVDNTKENSGSTVSTDVLKECFYSYCSTSSNDSTSESQSNASSDEEVAAQAVDCSPQEQPNGMTEMLKALPAMTLEERCRFECQRDDTVDHLVPATSLADSAETEYCTDMSKKVVQQVVPNVIRSKDPPEVGSRCMISCFKSPSEFYIQVADENAIFLDMMSAVLSKYYSDRTLTYSTTLQTKRGREIFYAACIGGLWYRIEVLDWLLNQPEKNLVFVLLIDYGIEYLVNFCYLRLLPPHLYEIPKMAQQCHLAYLYPPGSTKRIKLLHWPKETISCINELLGDLDETVFSLEHVCYCPEKGSFELEMSKVDEQNSRSLGQCLIDDGLAVEIFSGSLEITNEVIVKQICAAQGMKGISLDTPFDQALDNFLQQDTFEEPENVNEAVMSYNPRDEAQTCKNVRPDGTCYKGKRCQLRHVPLKTGYTLDKEAIFCSAFEVEPLPRRDDEVLMTVSHIIDFHRFYAQITRPEDKMQAKPLNRLINLMNHPNAVKGYKKFKHPPSPCQMVVVRHWNGTWYRGQVRNVIVPELENSVSVEVYVVDFGDTVVVSMADLRNIEPDFLRLPFQAVECRLYNIRHKRGLDPEEGKRQFENICLGKTFKAKIMDLPDASVLEIVLEVVLEDSEGRDVGIQLIEQGLGELNVQHFVLDNEIVLID